MPRQILARLLRIERERLDRVVADNGLGGIAIFLLLFAISVSVEADATPRSSKLIAADALQIIPTALTRQFLHVCLDSACAPHHLELFGAL
jgi:hypothetical protein